MVQKEILRYLHTYSHTVTFVKHHNQPKSPVVYLPSLSLRLASPSCLAIPPDTIQLGASTTVNEA